VGGLLIVEENVTQATSLIQPLLGVLGMRNGAPYVPITRALTVILLPLSFQQIEELGLRPMVEDGLLSHVPEFQILAMQQVRKMGQVDDTTISALITCLAVEDASVGKEAVQVISAVLPLADHT
jgi:hypothetical protein